MADGTTPETTGKTGTEGTPPAWTTGVEGELLGHAQNRGWDKLDPAAAARAALQAHREAEKLIGVPAEQVLRLPKKEDTAAWDGVYQRLGAPKEAKEYDFSTVKNEKGEALDEDLVAVIRDAAFKNHVTKEGAVEFAKGVLKYIDGTETREAADYQTKIAAEKVTLREAWGKYTDAKLVVAQRVAEVFKLTPEMVTALEGQVGYAAVMQGLAAIGDRIGEGKWIDVLGNKGEGGAITPEHALARKAELMSDKAWSDSYLAGDAKKDKEMQDLIRISLGG